ncbi:MAG: hypothetical protein JXA60_08670 [Candidatus Coatesbacteria bacterium]|nr:hypothetical protein [Candidatus Coatesbacteria bacterium]
MKYLVVLLTIMVLLVGNLFADEQSNKILEKVIEAKGGLKAIKKIKTVSSESEGLILTENQNIKISTRIILPDKYSVAMSKLSVTYLRIINENKTRLSLNGQPVKQTKDEDQEAFNSIYRSELYILTHLEDKTTSTAFKGEDKWQDTEVYKIMIDISGANVILYIDKTSYRIIGKSYETKHQLGTLQVEEVYRDYKTIENVVIPMRTLTRINGNGYIDATIKTIEFNGKIDKKIFNLD